MDEGKGGGLVLVLVACHAERSEASGSPAQMLRCAQHDSSRDENLDLIGHHILQGNYAEAVTLCERLLGYLPRHAPQRADVLAQLGTAHAMLQNFPQSYEAFTEALALEPNNAELWYNRGTASRFVSRFGQALQDIERAIALNTRSELAEKFEQELQFGRKMAEESRKLRGPHFTLDQLVEQEDLFQQGLTLMEAERWQEAGQAFLSLLARMCIGVYHTPRTEDA